MEEKLQSVKKALADEKETTARQKQLLTCAAEKELELTTLVSRLVKEKEAETEKFNKSGRLLHEAKDKIDQYKAEVSAMTDVVKAAEAESEAKAQELKAEKARSEELAARILILEEESTAKDLRHQIALEEERITAIHAFKA